MTHCSYLLGCSPSSKSPEAVEEVATAEPSVLFPSQALLLTVLPQAFKVLFGSEDGGKVNSGNQEGIVQKAQ